MAFQAVVSLLDPENERRVLDLWARLEECCGLSGIKVTPYPHFSWTVAEDYDAEVLGPRIQEIAQRTKPFIVRCSGLGIFPGQAPVVYIPVIKDETLLALHQEIWQATRGLELNPSSHYTPESWMPHVTLAARDVNGDNLGCALQELAYDSLHWQIRVDNLALVCQTNNEIGRLKDRFSFSET